MKKWNHILIFQVCLVSILILGNCSSGGGGSTGQTPADMQLSVTKSGAGFGAIKISTGSACWDSCTSSLASGMQVTLTPVPVSGSTFTGWTGGGCSGVGPCSVSMTANQTITATFAPGTATGRYRLPTRGLWTQFDRRGWPNGYWPGEVIQTFNDLDSSVSNTVSAEVALQLDAMTAMGVNSITIELRSADTSTTGSTDFVYPSCYIHPVLGFQYPQPTATELANFTSFLDLMQNKGVRVHLMLNNTHMEEQPPTNNQTWLGAILAVVKDHSALDYVSFGGSTRFIDTNGDGTTDACGVPAEPPLWLGPSSTPAQYVAWAINYGLSLGIPANKLSAEAVVGDFFVDSQPPAGPDATNHHLWSPIAVLKGIFDNLSIPDNERTYAISFYEHRKCDSVQGIACTDTDQHTWADQTLKSLFATIGIGNNSRVVATEMGAMRPLTAAWPAERAAESLVTLMEKYGVDGGSLWHWVSIDTAEETNPDYADAVKKRGSAFDYNPVQKEVVDIGGFHLAEIPNSSFETGTVLPDSWTASSGTGTATRYILASETGQPEVPSRGNYALRLVTGNTTTISASSAQIPVTQSTAYTTTANLRFSFLGDPNPGASAATRPQVFVVIHYLTSSGVTSSVQAQDVFRFFQENSTTGFATFPLQYTTPSDAGFVVIEIGAAQNGLSSAITVDADNLR